VIIVPVVEGCAAKISTPPSLSAWSVMVCETTNDVVIAVQRAFAQLFRTRFAQINELGPPGP
jgi:hypothetical protein